MKKVYLFVCVLASLMLMNCTEEVTIVGSPTGTAEVVDSTEPDEEVENNEDDEDDGNDGETGNETETTEEQCATCFYSEFSSTKLNTFCYKDGVVIADGDNDFPIDLDGQTFEDFLAEIEKNISVPGFTAECPID